MNNTLVILGRQPALGLAELENLYGAHNVRPIGKDVAQVSLSSDVMQFDRLGGAIKLCRVLSVFKTTKWQELQRAIEKAAPEYAATIPEGKLQLGLSAYDIPVSPQQILATGLSIKKALRKIGRSVRLIPNNEPALNSAQVLHNHLTGNTGLELVLVRDRDSVICAQTLFVQDINAYTVRDRGRPKRDARVGMLPPKLAQIIINLASDNTLSHSEERIPPFRLLDPFCGTGVILQEALLMGYEVLGTDIEKRMIEYSETNLTWLQKSHAYPMGRFTTTVGDATDYHWDPPINLVASETYLGRPFTAIPDPIILQKTIGDCNAIISKFLQNIHAQLKPNTRLCLAVPAWQQTPNKFKYLPLIDQIDEMGYNRVRFEHVRDAELLYYRENQVVARELLVITRK